MLKRIVGLVVGTTVACSSFMAFATVNTTTKYVNGDTSKVNVSSVVSGVKDGDTLTYLATVQGKELAKLVGDDIVYIDQVTLDGVGTELTTYSFDYTASKEKAINANVKVGGKISENGTIAGPGCEISIDGNKVATVPYGTEDEWFAVKYDDVAIVETVSVDGEVLDYEAEWIQGARSLIIKSSIFANKNSANVTVTKKSVSEAKVTSLGIASLIEKDGSNSVIMVGKLEGWAADYGIKIKVGDVDQILQAYGVGEDGRYAVKLTGLDADTVVNAYTYVGKATGDKWEVTTGTQVRGYKVVE